MRRVVFVTVVIATLAAGTAGCARPVSPAAGPAPGTTAGLGATAGPPTDRAAIYVAMLRRYLTSGESSFPGTTFADVYVLDYAGTTSPTGGATTTEPIPAADQAAIGAGLRDAGVGAVRFIPNREEVVDVVNGCAQVHRGGILITLGLLGQPSAARTDRVEVGISGFVACLGASWLTYVVERGADGWQVTGTTGSVAVA